MKAQKGTLNLYFATGEQPRPQFLSEVACDEKGFVVNFDGVYDIHEGDRIRFLHPALKRETFHTVGADFWMFLYYLSMMWDSKVEKFKVEYQPSKANKSWGDFSKDLQEDSKKRDKR